MFDVDKYINIQSELSNIQEKLKDLDKLRKEIVAKKIQTQSLCKHDLILVYSIDEDAIKQAKCLFCDTYLELDGNFEMFSEEYVDKNNIIDVTHFVSEFNQKLSKNGECVLVLRAKEKLQEMVKFAKRANIEFELNLIKNTIVNELISYDEQLKNERRKKLVKDKK